MFSLQRKQSAVFLDEVKLLLNIIKRRESKDLQKNRDCSEVVILRGLFYVHLYASLENAVRLGFQRAIQLINDSKMSINRYSTNFYALALDSQLNSISDTGKGKQLEKRFALFQLQSSRKNIQISDTLFDTYIQNVEPRVLRVIFDSLCIDSEVVSDKKYIGYLLEVKDKRNSVAHGDESAFDVGKVRRHVELVNLFEAVDNTINYYFDTLESSVCSNRHLQSRFRRRKTC